MAAAMRPKDVVIKYKELFRKSARDELTLIKLEDQLNLFSLNNSNNKESWELITKPTLLDRPLPSGRTRIVFIYSFIGFILGALISIFKEKNSGIIYEIVEIEKLIPINLISDIKVESITFESQKMSLIRDLIQQDTDKQINFVYLGDVTGNDLEIFKKALINEGFKKDIQFSSDFKLQEFGSNYLILKLGYIKYFDAIIFNKRLKLLKNNFKGLITLS